MKKTQVRWLHLAVASFSLLLFHVLAGPLKAQSTFGEMIGMVKDPGQGVVPGAQVTLTNVDEHTQHAAATDADGAFHFVNLKPGHYELVVVAGGFAEYKVTAAQLDARQTLRFDVTLGLAKQISLTERFHLRFEATFTNVLNHPNFAPPSMNISNQSTFGVLTSTLPQGLGGNRTGQLALRLDF